jgi:MFS family permease
MSLDVLTKHRDFRLLFSGSTVSLLGSSVTAIALPLTAVVYLHASAAQMGVLGAMAVVPHLVLGLPSGVWIDRMPYRRVLVLADLGQAAALTAIPLLAAANALQVWHLYAIVLVTGAGNLFETVTALSFTPMLVSRPSLLAANSSLMVSSAAVATVGTATAGVLVGWLTAPVAIAVDAASFLIAATLKARIGLAGHAPGPWRTRLGPDIVAGLRAVFADPIVRALIIAATVGAFGNTAQAVVFVLYLVTDLHLSAALVGVAAAISGIAGVVAGVLAPAISQRIGPGRAHITGMLFTSLAGLALAVTGWPTLALAQVLRGAGSSIFGVNQQTIRQARIGPETLARANATWRFFIFGLQSLGALAGGALGTVLGLRATLIVTSFLMLTGTAIAFLSPLRSLRSLS